MTLEETIELMKSEDWKDRYVAEYWQTYDRAEKLHKFIIKTMAGTAEFTSACSLEFLKEQEKRMRDYLEVLEVRAELDKIIL